MSITFPQVRREVGCYDFAHPNEPSACYTILLPGNAPSAFEHTRVTHCVEIDGPYDVGTDSALDAAEAMLKHASEMLWCGRLSELKAMVDYMQANHARHEVARYSDLVDKLERQLEDAKRELSYCLLEILPEPAPAKGTDANGTPG